MHKVCQRLRDHKLSQMENESIGIKGTKPVSDADIEAEEVKVNEVKTVQFEIEELERVHSEMNAALDPIGLARMKAAMKGKQSAMDFKNNEEIAVLDMKEKQSVMIFNNIISKAESIERIHTAEEIIESFELHSDETLRDLDLSKTEKLEAIETVNENVNFLNSWRHWYANGYKDTNLSRNNKNESAMSLSMVSMFSMESITGSIGAMSIDLDFFESWRSKNAQQVD